MYFLPTLILLVLSAGLNVYLFFRIKKPTQQFSADARALLHDLTAGNAIVRITRIAPEEVLLRSPREMI